MIVEEEISIEAVENLNEDKEPIIEAKEEARVMVITEEFLRLGGTSGIGWNKKQMEILGVEKKKGWMNKVIGKTLSDDDALRFLSYKGKKKKEIEKQELIDFLINYLESEGYSITYNEEDTYSKT